MRHVQLDAEETAQGVDVVVHGQQHLYTNETEDNAEAVLQVSEVLGNGGQGEVEGAEAEDGEDIGGEHDEGVAAD